MAECTACARPAPDATICPSCTGQAATYLRRIPWLTEQLTITLTRQARLGDRNGPRSTETPVVFEQRASADLEGFHTYLTRWALAVAEHRGISIDGNTQTIRLADGSAVTVPTAPTITELSRWLLRWNGAAAQHPDAGDYLDDLAAIVRGALHTIDRAPDLRYVGPCEDCQQDLYVHAERPPVTVYCPTEDCEAAYPMEERRAWLLEQTYGRLLTAQEMSRAIAALIPGEPLTPNRISQWAARDKITKYLPHPRDPHKRVRFLVEEVIRLLHASMDAKQTRKGA
jgi:hypothetical protein